MFFKHVSTYEVCVLYFILGYILLPGFDRFLTITHMKGLPDLFAGKLSVSEKRLSALFLPSFVNQPTPRDGLWTHASSRASFSAPDTGVWWSKNTSERKVSVGEVGAGGRHECTHKGQVSRLPLLWVNTWHHKG